MAAYDWYVATSQFFSNPLVTLLAGFALSVVAGRLSNVWQETARTGSKRKKVKRLFRQAVQIAKYRDIMARNIGGIQMTVFSERVIVSSIFVVFSALAIVFVIISHKDSEHTEYIYKIEYAFAFFLVCFIWNYADSIIFQKSNIL
ncbi:hypothetical protein [Mesorhizobium koreense]|uniref:hypothetical protein n=1 Tax=Mesorhizobium koreense TaxID=3074855 RepID=UPI00287B6229|nr:hypothetical protein [Mesorhizobium sp. WR6]